MRNERARAFGPSETVMDTQSNNPSTATLMIVGLVALGAALGFIWIISP